MFAHSASRLPCAKRVYSYRVPHYIVFIPFSDLVVVDLSPSRDCFAGITGLTRDLEKHRKQEIFQTGTFEIIQHFEEKLGNMLQFELLGVLDIWMCLSFVLMCFKYIRHKKKKKKKTKKKTRASSLEQFKLAPAGMQSLALYPMSIED